MEPVGNTYQPAGNVKLAYPAFAEGDDIHLEAAGDVLGGFSLDGPARGLLFDGTTTIEVLCRKASASTARAALAALAVAPVDKSLVLDVAALLRELDPSGKFYPHDRLEGLAIRAGGDLLVLANDSDFGVDGAAGVPVPKTIPPPVRSTTARC